jgi:Xaa-Pro aminopeptidase
MMNEIEGTSAKFNLETYLEARKMARKIILLTASQVDVGMTEADGEEILDQLFKNFGIEKKWHPHKFRIGVNTTKSFREKSEPNIKLAQNDIYFIDIGPVIDGHEADFGQTFTTGQNPENSLLQKSSRDVFNEVQTIWKEEGLSGTELYSRAAEMADSKGYILNTNMNGHRLGDFPHALYYKGKLQDFDKKPIENLWVLEILLRHKELEIGAFYEDILI